MSAAVTGPVVVEVSGSAEGLRTVDYAAREALRTGADLLLARHYHAYTSYTPMTPMYFSQSPSDEANRALREARLHVERQLGSQVTARTLALEGPRLDVLPHLARSARLLVIARRRARRPHRGVAAQTDLALASRTACPVTVVPGNWKPSTAELTIAVGVDGTALSWEAVEYAFAVAADRSAHLIVIHAAGGPRRRDDADAGADAETAWIDSAELTVAETLAGWQQKYPGVTVTRFLSSEPVIDTLTQQAQHAGLLVLGVHSASTRLIGDPVTRRMLCAATCPVTMARHHVTAAERRRPLRAGGGDLRIPTY